MLANYMIHHFGTKLIYMQGLSLAMWGTALGTIWLVDTYHFSMSQRALSAGDPATAEKHLGRVRMLRGKEDSIRRKYGLVRPYFRPKPAPGSGLSQRGLDETIKRAGEGGQSPLLARDENFWLTKDVVAPASGSEVLVVAVLKLF